MQTRATGGFLVVLRAGSRVASQGHDNGWNLRQLAQPESPYRTVEGRGLADWWSGGWMRRGGGRRWVMGGHSGGVEGEEGGGRG